MFVETPLHGLRDRMLALRSLPHFGGLTDESLLQIAEHTRERRFAAGDLLLHEGHPVDHIYIIVSGAVTTSRKGKPFMVITGSGAVGILAAMAQDATGWHAVADKDTLTLEIPSQVFVTSLKEDFGLLRNALRIMAGMALESRGKLPIKPQLAKPALVGDYPDRDPTLIDRVIGLRTTDGPFRTANMDAIFELCRRMTLHRIDPGTMLWEIGDLSTFSARLLYGRVRCTAASGEYVDVGTPFALGALDSWAVSPRSYAARAETKVVYWRIPAEDFLSILEMHPSLALGLIRNVAGSLIAAADVAPEATVPPPELRMTSG